ncbi:YiiX/YebB-like N1pC/P60 family cysteine hydrolase [Arenimonas aestuarii]
MRLTGPLAAAMLAVVLAGPGAARLPAAPALPALLDVVPLAAWQGELRPGDLVFRRGNGLWSGYFAGASGDEGFFSHVGLLVREGGRWQVVHTEADDRTGVGGVRTDSLRHFLADAHGVAVVRPRLDPAQVARTVALARDRRWQAIPFDGRFRLDDGGEAMYCTEWIQALMLAATGEDIARPRSHFGRIEIISIDDLRLSARVEPVFDHRLATNGR